MGRNRETRLAALLAAAAGAIGAGCSDEAPTNAPTPSYPTAATLGEQDVRPVDEYLASPPYDAADVDNGARLAATCRACHTLEAGGANRIGPNLHAFFGENAGSADGFAYSPALAEAGFVWTPRALDAWLAAPGRFLPGNRMSFAGVPAATDRVDLIAYLLDATRTP